MDQINRNIFLVEERCSSCRREGFTLCFRLSTDLSYYLCLTCIMVLFNEQRSSVEESESESESESEEIAG